MESSLKRREKVREKRSFRVRKRLRGSSEKPRLSVIRSNCNIYVQLIDDEAATTLASTSTLAKEFKNSENSKKNQSSAKHLGLKIAELAKSKNVQACVFDRGRYKYHGVIAMVAEGAREGGLKF